MNSEIRARFERNVVRVRHLVDIYNQTTTKVQGRKAVAESDVLRAAVVLLHAAVEDVLRSLERRTLPTANATLLEDVPLAGGRRATKHSLADLAQFRGKTVAEVIDQSVDGHLQRMTYNNPDELAAVLTRLGADPQTLNSQFQVLERVMKRRHHIVHRADREESRGSGHHGVKSLSTAQVIEWINVAESFINAVFNAVPDISGPAP